MVTKAEKKEYQREWYLKNVERQRKKNAERYAADRGQRVAKGRKWALANKDKVRDYQKRWRAANKASIKTTNARWQLKKLYGITPEDRERMFKAQGRVCKCCGSTEPKAANGWHVDHCHKTGLVRGILCQQCNIMLGCAADDPQILLKGVQYLLLA